MSDADFESLRNSLPSIVVPEKCIRCPELLPRIRDAEAEVHDAVDLATVRLDDERFEKGPYGPEEVRKLAAMGLEAAEKLTVPKINQEIEHRTDNCEGVVELSGVVSGVEYIVSLCGNGEAPTYNRPLRAELAIIQRNPLDEQI